MIEMYRYTYVRMKLVKTLLKHIILFEHRVARTQQNSWVYLPQSVTPCVIRTVCCFGFTII
jgi:hypothetical protein